MGAIEQQPRSSAETARRFVTAAARHFDSAGTRPRHYIGFCVDIGRCALVLARPREETVMFGLKKKVEMPSAEEALPGRSTPIATAERHFVNGRPLQGPYPKGLAK